MLILGGNATWQGMARHGDYMMIMLCIHKTDRRCWNKHATISLSQCALIHTLSLIHKLSLMIQSLHRQTGQVLASQ